MTRDLLPVPLFAASTFAPRSAGRSACPAPAQTHLRDHSTTPSEHQHPTDS